MALSHHPATAAPSGWVSPNFQRILPELQSLPNWVLAKLVYRDERWTKVPLQPNGRSASVASKSTWSGFETVQAAFDPAMHIGIGFVLDGLPHFDGKYLHGFDWDHCISDGHIDPAVRASVIKLNIPRLEVSVSGTGLRGFFLHDQMLPSRKRMIEGRSVELYSGGRYLITTGWAFSGREALS